MVRIQIGEIPEEGLRLQITDAAWFPDQEVCRCGPVTATAFLRRHHQHIFLDGSLATEVLLDCDRCLESYRAELATDFHLELELPGSGGPAADREHVCSREEMDVEFLDEPVVDVFRILRQQVYLTIPTKKLCTPECRGLCSQCGANLNAGDCPCQQERKASPFEALSRLKH